MSGTKSDRLNNKEEERKNEASLDNEHQIYQTDEAITVIYNEMPSRNLEHTRTSVNENKSSDDNRYHAYANESNERLKISEEDLSMNIDSAPSSSRKNSNEKKSVSFENDESIRKFISGEVIVDQKNPFRYDEVGRKRISKLKSSDTSKATRATTDETDFITKEEILKQSKYVPVYIRNPDKVLTYDRSVLESLPKKTQKVVKRAPVPVPRKAIRKEKEVNSQVRNGQGRNGHVKTNTNIKYPDLSDIKVENFFFSFQTFIKVLF